MTGHIGPDVIRGNTEQRIIEPELRNTAVARRDIRAVPGPPARDANNSYTSDLAFNGDTFTATYVFDDPAVARVAAGASLGERLLSWQLTDAAANRQGVTIAEAGEPGGPGMGGCPNGPLQSGPPAPTDIRAVAVSGGARLTWTPAVAVPGTRPITGYRVTAVAQTTTNNERAEIGRRISGQPATGTTLTGLAAGETYDIEVVSVSDVGQTFPPVTVHVETDVTAPVLSASPAGGSFAVAQRVTLSSNEAGTDLYYSTDGSDLIVNDTLSDTAVRYTGPVDITANTVLKYVGYDPAGNVGSGQQTYTITNTPVPAAPTLAPPTVGQGTVALSWTPADSLATSFGVQVYDAAGSTPVGALRTTADAATTTMTITDLTPDTAYRYTVLARNANGDSPESNKVGPAGPQGAVVANAGPDQTVARQAGPTTITLDGSGSTAGATYRWTQLSGDPVTFPGGRTVASTTARLPVFSSANGSTNNPLTFQLSVTVGTNKRTDEVTITIEPDQLAVTTARWKAGDFRVVGVNTVVGATVRVHSGSPTGLVLGQTVSTAAVAPATGGDVNLRLRNGAAPASNPGQIWLESTAGGTTGPFPVS